MISGVATVEDESLFPLLALLKDSEALKIEPSAAAGFIGPFAISATDYANDHGIAFENATHIVWLTGGALVPDGEMAAFYERGRKKMGR
ncbi:hypothetical protein [Planococcus dechangensis]|uniref:Pyridoxal-phosphate dependent enzyme n=1 Tax=Planococcus dechangensis TaxID=1176255 RepID=A0ABV9M9I8_9BACL